MSFALKILPPKFLTSCIAYKLNYRVYSESYYGEFTKHLNTWGRVFDTFYCFHLIRRSKEKLYILLYTISRKTLCSKRVALYTIKRICYKWYSRSFFYVITGTFQLNFPFVKIILVAHLRAVVTYYDGIITSDRRGSINGRNNYGNRKNNSLIACFIIKIM